VPWNYPLIISTWKMGPALLMGNSVVLKPANNHHCQGSARELACEAGVRRGTFNVVPGFGEEAGKALALHPDVDLITFTGSTEVGRLMLRYAAESNLKRVALECGGKTPQVVFADAIWRPPPTASPGDLLQQRRDLPRRLAPDRARIRQGRPAVGAQARDRDHHLRSPLDPATQMGALIDRAHMQRVLGFIDSGVADGARIALGGKRALEETAAFTSRRPCLMAYVPK